MKYFIKICLKLSSTSDFNIESEIKIANYVSQIHSQNFTHNKYIESQLTQCHHIVGGGEFGIAASTSDAI